MVETCCVSSRIAVASQSHTEVGASSLLTNVTLENVRRSGVHTDVTKGSRTSPRSFLRLQLDYLLPSTTSEPFG